MLNGCLGVLSTRWRNQNTANTASPDNNRPGLLGQQNTLNPLPTDVYGAGEPQQASTGNKNLKQRMRETIAKTFNHLFHRHKQPLAVVPEPRILTSMPDRYSDASSAPTGNLGSPEQLSPDASLDSLFSNGSTQPRVVRDEPYGPALSVINTEDENQAGIAAPVVRLDYKDGNKPVDIALQLPEQQEQVVGVRDMITDQTGRLWVLANTRSPEGLEQPRLYSIEQPASGQPLLQEHRLLLDSQTATGLVGFERAPHNQINLMHNDGESIGPLTQIACESTPELDYHPGQPGGHPVIMASAFAHPNPNLNKAIPEQTIPLILPEGGVTAVHAAITDKLGQLWLSLAHKTPQGTTGSGLYVVDLKYPTPVENSVGKLIKIDEGIPEGMVIKAFAQGRDGYRAKLVDTQGDLATQWYRFNPPMGKLDAQGNTEQHPLFQELPLSPHSLFQAPLPAINQRALSP